MTTRKRVLCRIRVYPTRSFPLVNRLLAWNQCLSTSATALELCWLREPGQWPPGSRRQVALAGRPRGSPGGRFASGMTVPKLVLTDMVVSDTIMV